jgi:cytochrome P450
MKTERPAPIATNPISIVAGDFLDERRSRGRYPPGPLNWDLRRTLQFTRDPLPILLPLYERYGPIFTVRMMHQPQIFMLGPAANHYMTVSHPENFLWRDGHFGQLAWLMGDGLLTIDGDYHDRARRIMMPAFHRERIEEAVEIMVDEAGRAMQDWSPGTVVDVYDWMRVLAMRIAMRALFGLDPDDHDSGAAMAQRFERALAFYGTSGPSRLLRGPRSPYARMRNASRRLDEIVYAEIARRRADPDPDRRDVLSMLIEAEDEDGSRFSDEEIRDQVMTLLFAGHDTSTSTVTFLLYELARHPQVLARLYQEQDRVLGSEPPGFHQLHGELAQLDMAVDETLRLYPPAWVGPRKTVREFEFEGHHVPARAYINYSSWASHRLPDVFPEPEAFIPERFTPERKAALPKGAYVPFGGGSRICIGKRFGQTEVKVVTATILQRFRLELLPGRTMTIRQMPTLSPRDGLPMTIRSREVPEPAHSGGQPASSATA